MNDTTVTDSFGRKVEFSEKRFLASAVTGLIPVSYLLDNSSGASFRRTFSVKQEHIDLTQDDV